MGILYQYRSGAWESRARGGGAGGGEPALGNPSVDGYVLSSTTAGVRSWVAQGGSGSFATDFYGTMSGNYTHTPSASWLKVPFDTATRDTNSEFNAGTDLWVCGTTGTYVISVLLRWTANNTGYRGAAVSVNGDSTIDGDEITNININNGSTYAARNTFCLPLALTATDTVGIYAMQSSGGSLDIIASGSMFCIWRIA